MNIPVKVTPPARVKRPWILGAIIAALLAVAAVISLYEFSPGFRCAVEYKPVDKQLCVVKNASLGEITVECHKKRSGWGYMLVTSNDMYIQVDRPDFERTRYLEEFSELTADERHEVETYLLNKVITPDSLSRAMTSLCMSWDYTQIVRAKESGSGYGVREISPYLFYDGSNERYVYFSAGIWGINTVHLKLDRTNGEITACAPTVYSP